jgi:hypothetical protein
VSKATGFQSGGRTVAQDDFRYIRRFVTVAGVPVLAGDTYAVTNAVGATEVALANPNGAVEALLPITALGIGFREAGDGGRFGNRIKVTRIGSTPVIAGIRGEGTYQAPTPPLINAVLLQINARPITDTGGAGTATVTGSLNFVARENLSATAWGTLVRIALPRLGTVLTDNIVDFRSGGAAVGEVVGGSATIRYIPATTGQLRNPANTANLVEWNATGLGFFNVAPIARPNITGARGGNAALASLLTNGALLGLWTDGTTA